MTTHPSREEMIKELTEYELVYLVENYDAPTLKDVSKFFANGGFNTKNDEDLKESWDDKFGEDHEIDCPAIDGFGCTCGEGARA